MELNAHLCPIAQFGASLAFVLRIKRVRMRKKWQATLWSGIKNAVDQLIFGFQVAAGVLLSGRVGAPATRKTGHQDRRDHCLSSWPSGRRPLHCSVSRNQTSSEFPITFGRLHEQSPGQNPPYREGGRGFRQLAAS